MKSLLRVWMLIVATGASFDPAPCREFLTPSEIERVQEAQEIDRRVKVYMEAAELRLKTANERLSGRESNPGDPMEFFSVEDMIEGYYSIIRSVMLNLDGAAQRPSTDKAKFSSALKTLRDSTEKAVKELAILKLTAEERQKEELWNLVNRAMDIAHGAHEGAQSALGREK